MSEKVLHISRTSYEGKGLNREVTQAESKALKVISKDSHLLALFTSHLAELSFADEISDTVDKVTIGQYAMFGAAHALFLVEAVSSIEWPEDRTPQAYYADALESWYLSGVGATVDGMNLAEYIEAQNA